MTFALFVRAVCKTSNEMARMQSGRVRLAISPAKLVRYRDRRVLVIGQIAMHRGHYLSTLADCRRDPLDRTGTNIADREDAGARRLQLSAIAASGVPIGFDRFDAGSCCTTARAQLIQARSPRRST